MALGAVQKFAMTILQSAECAHKTGVNRWIQGAGSDSLIASGILKAITLGRVAIKQLISTFNCVVMTTYLFIATFLDPRRHCYS